MHLRFGAPPFSADFAPDSSWNLLREPSLLLSQLIALPIGVITAGAIAVLWYSVTPLQDAQFSKTWWPYVLLYLGLCVIHELVHTVPQPLAGGSEHSFVGFWPKYGVFYAHYDGELSRNRFVVILLMPVLLLSVLPLVVAAVLHSSSCWVATISCLNALLTCVDLLVAGLVLFQVPASASVRNQGWRTYWREHEHRSRRSCTPPVPPEARAGAGTGHGG